MAKSNMELKSREAESVRTEKRMNRLAWWPLQGSTQVPRGPDQISCFPNKNRGIRVSSGLPPFLNHRALRSVKILSDKQSPFLAKPDDLREKGVIVRAIRSLIVKRSSFLLPNLNYV